ncbi:MAG: hypothetical protein K9M45_06515 [Kiritimatiellales bacterium]|nr:hypothetical protein [Kiritimatiellales bacterium]
MLKSAERSVLILLSLFSVCVGMADDCLFKKYGENPVFDIGRNVPAWRSKHLANVSVLKPSDNPAGKWLLYCRGSGNNKDGYHDTIGLFEQSAAGFNPHGPWIEYPGNPVLSYGPKGSHDEKHLLDTAAVRGADGKIIVYYKSRDNAGNIGLCAAVSKNGYSFKKLDNPMLRDTGINDVVYHNGKYYLFRGEMANVPREEKGKRWVLRVGLNVSSKFNAFPPEPDTIALSVGRPDAYDSRCVCGAKIFRVRGDSRWFMLYQTSEKHIDYPDRFHAAYSRDLIHWTKVVNKRPLMTRGAAGEWDQGGIWTGSVIEYDGSLHIYYEGWGSFGAAPDRDNLYYRGGSSRVGIASVPVSGFLKWVNE